jgi:ATP-dependent helicase YprA (DUF1998 family)
VARYPKFTLKEIMQITAVNDGKDALEGYEVVALRLSSWRKHTGPCQSRASKNILIEPDFEPNIFIYDNFPGDIGPSPTLFDLEKDLLKHGLKTINVCPCKEGCPSCVGPSQETGRRAKQVAQKILRGLLEE